MPRFNTRIAQALSEREQQGLYRQRVCLTRNAQQVSEASHTWLNFSSNDYLGLAQEPSLLQAWQQGLTLYGAGSGASPLVTGFHSPHAKLEQQLAEWLGYDRALLFNSGFSANQAVLFTLLAKNDWLLQDKLNHASLMEAGMLSPATMKRFKHNDVAHLSRLLSSAAQSDAQSDLAKLVVTEGVFSMDGDLAPLAEMAAVSQQHDAWLMVDDAHGCGVLGEAGRGSCDLAEIKADILIVTFGKAFGLQGAAVLCSEDVAEYLIQFARHFVYSTAMPPAQAYALVHACERIQQDQWRRDKLVELSDAFALALDPAIGFQNTPTPIKPLLLGDSNKAVKISQALKEQGLWVSAIRPPTVPVNSARLRITFTANHQLDDVKRLATAINEVMYD
ncbi:8-amino-7-oxononanoate synthase [Photobacterium jeanii]|uniref:8-amino-7-oxononanoate synthase n=1 Tax=Photobacterium jeanii TaxID=858640 RepID=A0A178KMF1_9GAMM|nr:8-amino-7-oxononanoate synthase [Photobacterium jeanii]OAN18175.1 8-amino-7-oxononanoate synthase [Photobacterium jeanii]PST92148.1 8-amino-7-oxononanoate synthase [Photobacterium jeanii]